MAERSRGRAPSRSTGAGPERDTDLARMSYEHPIYTPASVAAQAGLPALNDGRTAFAGAYHGWGFHEDGCRSGVAAAASLRAAPTTARCW